MEDVWADPTEMVLAKGLAESEGFGPWTGK